MCIQIASTGIVITGTRPVADGQWHHVALTRAGSSMRLFVDGIQSGSTYTNASAFTAGATNGMFIGCLGAGVGGFLQGNVSDFRVVNGTALYTANFAPPATPLTAVANTSLLTLQTNQPHTNSQFLDNSTSALPITRAGNTTQGSFSPYGANWSNYLPSAGSTYLFGGSSTSLALGPGNFTLEGWFYIQALAPSYSTLFDWRTNGSIIATVPVVTDFNNNGKLAFVYGNGSSTAFIQVVESSTTMPVGSWFHMALVRSGTTVTMYFNGTSVGSATSSQDFGLQNFNIGNTQSTNYTPSMYVSNVRLVKGSAVYTSAFTPSTTPLTAITNTTLLTCQSPRYVDNSINNIALSATTNVSVQKFSPFSLVTQTPTTHSVYFDGSGDYLQYQGSATTTLSGDFTLEAWVNVVNFSSGRAILCIGDSYAAPGAMFYIDNAAKLGLAVPSRVYTSSGTVPANTWTHIALVRNSGVITGYINGISQGTASNSSTISGTNSYIGQEIYNGGLGGVVMYGYMSNLRLVKGTAVYTSNFTPPTSPLTAVTGTSLLTCQDATIRDNSSNNFVLTVAGNATPRQQNPFGWTTSSAQDYTPAVFGSSAYFDGTGDFLTNSGSNAFTMGTGPFTVEYWCYPTANLGGFQQHAGSSISASGFAYGLNGLNPYLTTSVNGYTASNGSLTLSAWNYISWTRDSSNNVRCFLNGILVYGPTSITTNITETGFGISATSGGQYRSAGYLSSIRVVKGTSLYSSNFVPPQAPLQAVQNTTLLLNMDHAAVQDKSGKVVLETVGDAKVSTVQKKYGTSSMYFDGSGDYLTFPSNPQYAFGTGDFTVECWVNSADVSTAQKGFIQTSDVVGGLSTGYATGITFLFGARQNGSGAASLSGAVLANIAGTNIGSSAAVVTANTWTHLALVRASGTVTIYVDGVSVGSGTAAGNCSGTNLVVGGYYSTGYLYNGYIDDLRITRGYARYTANFTPPTQALLTK
jgi:hypothetical protein